METEKIFIVLRDLALAVAITVTLPITIYWGVQLLSTPPAYEERSAPEELVEQQRQLQRDVRLLKDKQELAPSKVINEQLLQAKIKLDTIDQTVVQQEKQSIKLYDQKRERHSRIEFVVYLACALLAILSGCLIRVKSVGVGIILGGVVLLIMGMTVFAHKLPHVVRFGVVFAILALVIALAFWLAKKK